jgi:hypothetical protein
MLNDELLLCESMIITELFKTDLSLFCISLLYLSLKLKLSFRYSSLDQSYHSTNSYELRSLKSTIFAYLKIGLYWHNKPVIILDFKHHFMYIVLGIQMKEQIINSE